MNIEDLMLDFTLPGYDIELKVKYFLNDLWCFTLTLIWIA